MSSARQIANLLALLVLVQVGCGGLPTLRPMEHGGVPPLRARCEGPFPPGGFTVVHAIHARLPLGQRTALIGVATWDARARTLRVMALALEGVTLLDLELRGERVTVNRAVPPLDRRGFAEGLAKDVRLLLSRPQEASVSYGRLPDGGLACRFRGAQGGAVDVIPRVNDAWSLRLYDAQGRLRRRVEARGAPRGRFAREMSLSAPGPGGYELTLTLLRVEPGQDDTSLVPHGPARGGR